MRPDQPPPARPSAAEPNPFGCGGTGTYAVDLDSTGTTIFNRTYRYYLYSYIITSLMHNLMEYFKLATHKNVC